MGALLGEEPIEPLGGQHAPDGVHFCNQRAEFYNGKINKITSQRPRVNISVIGNGLFVGKGLR